MVLQLNLIGQTITGETSGATAIVVSTISFREGYKQYC